MHQDQLSKFQQTPNVWNRIEFHAQCTYLKAVRINEWMLGNHSIIHLFSSKTLSKLSKFHFFEAMWRKCDCGRPAVKWIDTSSSLIKVCLISSRLFSMLCDVAHNNFTRKITKCSWLRNDFYCYIHSFYDGSWFNIETLSSSSKMFLRWKCQVKYFCLGPTVRLLFNVRAVSGSNSCFDHINQERHRCFERTRWKYLRGFSSYQERRLGGTKPKVAKPTVDFVVVVHLLFVYM